MKPELIDKIERYLEGAMEPHERTEFEAALASDESLRKEFELYNSINRTMSAPPNENELREILQQMNKKYFAGETIVKTGSFKRWLAVAASLVLLASVVFYFLFTAKPSADKLYAEFAIHDALSIQQRGIADDSLAVEAAGKFNEKYYKEALPLLQKYIRQQPEDIQAKFSLAICYLETGAYSEAEKIFSETAAGQTAYAQEAVWYLALTALKQKDIPHCRSFLEKIDQTSPYYNRAKQLLDKLPG